MRPKILLFIDWFLPGTASGGPVRSITNMADHLKDYCDFYIVTRNNDYCSNKTYNLEIDVWIKLENNLYVKYLEPSMLKISHYKTIYNELNFTTVYINGIYSLKFSIFPIIALRRYAIDIVVGARGMLNPQAFSVKPTKKNIFLNLAKRIGLYKNVTFHATNLEEAKNIKSKISKNSAVKVAANFPRLSMQTPPVKLTKKPGNLKLINLARISKEKGTLYAIKSLQNIEHGHISLDIYGSIYDENYWNECLIEIDKLPNSIEVKYKGVLDAEKVPEVMSTRHIFIMPSEGENFGHSILEALSAGLPVIISNNTPWIGLSEKMVGWDLDLSQKNDFSLAINQAIRMDQKEYDLWSRQALFYAKEIINNPKTLEDNLEMLNIDKKIKMDAVKN